MQMLESGVLFLAAGVLLTFFYRQWMEFALGKARVGSPNGKAPLEGLLLSPVYVWIMRFVGVACLVMGVAALWIYFTGKVPFS
jgi:hypothetical protein